MLFYSTNRQSPDVSFRNALMTGQAPDKGLYMPREIPKVSMETLEKWRSLDYPELAYEVLSLYTKEDVSADTQRMLCYECYNFEIPLEKVFDRNYLMRLDRGPTASFKDFAARMMARWTREFLKEENREITILTATSGDTGSAVAHAFHGLDNIRVVVLFPQAEVSARQRKQMTTLGNNITTIGIDGKFDDAQAMVKQAFADPELSKINLSSANSINIGRLLPQSVYYVWAYLQNSKLGEDIVFCVPSGNFGDMMGGMLAWRMGIPVRKMIVAVNSNYEFPEYLSSEVYNKIVPSKNALSNAMNVGHPSNLARLVELYGGIMRETGEVSKQPDLDAMRKDLYSVSVDDEWTKKNIRESYEQYGILLEPHGSVGWAALLHWIEEGNNPGFSVTLETAHPAKFPDEIIELLGITPDPPPSLEGLDDLEEHWLPMKADYNEFKEFLKKNFI